MARRRAQLVGLFHPEQSRARAVFVLHASQHGIRASGALWTWFAMVTGCFASPVSLDSCRGRRIGLSVPLIPTSDADRMRIYAATMPVLFLIPAFSLAGWRAWMGRFAPSIPILSRSERSEEEH